MDLSSPISRAPLKQGDRCQGTKAKGVTKSQSQEKKTKQRALLLILTSTELSLMQELWGDPRGLGFCITNDFPSGAGAADSGNTL